MKFIVHNLRMIRARLRNNGWVLAELFLVFIVMWFLCDSLGCLKYTFYRPLGYDIDHVYQLSMITGGESRDAGMTIYKYSAKTRKGTHGGSGRPVVLEPADER